MAVNWTSIFDNYGIKVVTSTDKAKKAYVPNAAQLRAINAAGIRPSDSRPAEDFPVVILGGPLRVSVGASFYHSLRKTDPLRRPEPRMGHEFITRWLKVGDQVVIGNVGKQLFASKVTASLTDDALSKEISKRADPETVFALARKAKGKPARITVTREDFIRNPYVVAAALLRAKEACEMPGCKRDLFRREDGGVYLEVHHILPLGEGGDDSLGNVAALCPHCHRRMHFGKGRLDLRKRLTAVVAR